jgi:hypothetical protein
MQKTVFNRILGVVTLSRKQTQQMCFGKQQPNSLPITIVNIFAKLITKQPVLEPDEYLLHVDEYARDLVLKRADC